ncbi:MAG: aldose epimerase family protein [Ruegeria sp.]
MQIEQVSLTDETMSVSLLNYGAVTQGWWLDGTPLILGYENPQGYLTDAYYLGAIVGRVANRIGRGQFELDGICRKLDANEGENTLHGGSVGLSRQFWTIRQIAPNEAVLNYLSPDGEGGFPGSVDFQVRVLLHSPCLTYEIKATPDRATPISVAQHNYYCLGSKLRASDLRVALASNQFLETDKAGIATGMRRNGTEIGIGSAPDQLSVDAAQDIDHFFVFDPKTQQTPVATITAKTGLRLNVYSDQPGAQIYTGGHLSHPFPRNGGVCVEPSGYPNAVNVPGFPSVIHTPDNPYYQKLTLKIERGRD